MPRLKHSVTQGPAFQNPDARMIVAASQTDANLLWATEMFAPDPFIFIMKRGRKFLVMSDLEVDRARDQASVDAVLRQSDYADRVRQKGVRFPTTPQVLAEVLGDLKIRGVLVPANFPAGLADALREAGFGVAVQPDPFWPDREVKTQQEIRFISDALRAAETGMEAGIAALRRARIGKDGYLYLDGTRLTSKILKSIINTAVIERGCVPSHTIAASGEQAVDPHNTGSGPIRAHTPIIIDIFPRSQETGYFGDMTRTVVRGRATETLKRVYKAVEEAQKIGFRKIRARASAYDIHTDILTHFQRHGFETATQGGRMQGFFHGTGHGLGLDIHEAPSFGLRTRNRFRKNHVVTVEPGLYYSGIGGVRLEDVVVVTETGCRNLVRFPKFLEI